MNSPISAVTCTTIPLPDRVFFRGPIIGLMQSIMNINDWVSNIGIVSINIHYNIMMYTRTTWPKKLNMCHFMALFFHTKCGAI